jgi:hypothetical protein
MLYRWNAHTIRVTVLLVTVCSLIGGAAAVPVLAHQARIDDPFTTTFNMERCSWSTTGGSIFFSLDPGMRTVHEGEEDGEAAKLVTTVLGRTKRVAGVRTRVIEEQHVVNDEVVEVSRNFYALCRETSSVFYFGEEVDFYADGEIVGHDGAWQAGVDGAVAGLYMPGLPLLGARYYQEIAEGVALDRVEIVSLSEHANVPYGAFDGCMATVETTPLEPGAESLKTFCPGVGIVDDDGLLLVAYRPGYRRR